MSLTLAIEAKVQRLGDSPSGCSLIANVAGVSALQEIITTFLETGTLAKLANGIDYRFDATATTGGQLKVSFPGYKIVNM